MDKQTEHHTGHVSLCRPCGFRHQTKPTAPPALQQTVGLQHKDPHSIMELVLLSQAWEVRFSDSGKCLTGKCLSRQRSAAHSMHFQSCALSPEGGWQGGVIIESSEPKSKSDIHKKRGKWKERGKLRTATLCLH